MRIGARFLPGNPYYNYAPRDFRRWREESEQYARETQDYWLQFYRPGAGDTIIDVGAGHGEDTLTFSRAVGPGGRVIAIEAHPLSFDALRIFCRLNRLSNVKPVHLALMEKPGEVRLVESDSSWMENHIKCDEGASGIPVQAGTLDDLCIKEGIGNISFLKMNIEGAERFALLGAVQTMPRIRQICVACHDFRSNHGHGEQFRTRAFVERFLAEHGFSLASRPNDPRDAVRDHIFGLRLN